MRKVTEQHKLWQHTRQIKVMRARARMKKGSEKHRRIHYENLKICNNVVKLTAPINLSLIKSKDDTLNFFRTAIHATRVCNEYQSIYFDLKAVELITPDAIMYLIAIINNVKRVQSRHITVLGNLPQNKVAREVIEKSGFYSYVNGPKNKDTSTTLDTLDMVQIKSGKTADSVLIASICDFVCNNSSGNILETKRLYPMLMELMTNTVQHAYNDKEKLMDNRWYIYVENKKDIIEFIFLDTGSGIPATIRLNFTEKIQSLMLNRENDAKLISSALRGDFRTETRQTNRGKGLPDILADSRSAHISELTVISGKGECCITESYNIKEQKSNIAFKGTLFRWIYSKKEAA